MSSVNDRSTQYYVTPAAVEEYVDLKSLWKPEKVIVARYEDELRGAVLDLGMGAGRTSAHLLPNARRYVGLDYSEAMVDVSRRKFEDGDFQQGDASDLSRFEDGTFDVVLFSFNGLDCVDHATRLAILAEVRRVLAPAGLFIFSFHSRDAKNRVKAFRLRNFRPSRAWLTTTVRGISSYYKVRGDQVEHQTYEIMSDPEGCYGCMAYFITKSAQRDQLVSAGFSDVEMYNFSGHAEPIDNLDRESFWFYVTCRPTQPE
jgi:ubiquinone/menaquinone biosynthesis C-methylase UbiE